jgi:hypothetical protein
MDLTKFNFPELTSADKTFSSIGIEPKLLEEAKKRGFYNKKTPYNKLFSKIFLQDKVEIIFKRELDEYFKKGAWAYCTALMRSFAPRHQAKEAVCTMLMSELLEIPNNLS